MMKLFEKNVELERMECRDTQVSCMAARTLVEPLEVCRPQEGLKTKAPKYPEILSWAIRRAPHREAFIPDIKSWVSKTGWQGYKSTPTLDGHACGSPTRLQGHSYTWVLQDLGICDTQTSKRSFWCPDDQHSCQPSSRAIVVRYW
jgi:hypothetical protein